MGKIKHFFHILFVSYLVISIIFSGMPFEGIIQHLREGNIVDVMYHAQKNGNVIDTALNEFVVPKIPHAYANGTTDAMMTYDTLNGTSVPKYRLWNGTSWGAEQSANPVNGTEIYHMMLKYAPTRDEAILVVLTNSGQVQAQVFNGTSWSGVTVLSNVGSASVNPNSLSLYRGFDIEYERSSGDAIVVAGDSTADPNYYVWNGTSWASGVDINIPTTGSPYWIELASRPGSDELALITLDSNSDVYGMRWTGGAWDTMGVATTWETTAGSNTRKSIDVAYEKTSGDIMFAWGFATAATAHFRYRTYSGATLGAVTNVTNANNGGVAHWVKLASNPTTGSDQIMIGLHDAGADLNTFIWSGTAWSAVHAEHSGATENGAADMDFDIAFETHSSNPGDAWLLWSDGATVSRKLWDGGTSAWQAATTMGDDNMGIVLNAHPNNGAVLAGVYEDDTSVTDDIREAHLTGGSQTWSAIAQIWAGPTRRNLGVLRMAQDVQAYSSSTEAMWAYVTEDSTTYPRYRRWTGSAWGSELAASGTNGELRHMVLKTSPKRDEAMLVTLGNNGRVEAQAWNGSTGTWGSATLLNTVSNANGNRDVQSLYRGFDIEYENSSGDAIVVTGDGTADPNYWVWNGTSWTGPVDINIPTTGIPSYIKLAGKSGTDELALITLDSNSDVYGMRWTGSAWDAMGTATTWETTASIATKEAIDVAYEKTSGDIMFAWGFATAATAHFRYRTYSGTTLGAVTNIVNANQGGVLNWLTLASNPVSGSDQIMIGLLDAGADLNTYVWDGTSSWGTVHTEHTAAAETIASRAFHIAYETHPSNPNVAWLAYGDGNLLSRKRWSGTVWGAATTQGDDTDLIQLNAHPNSGAFFMMAYESTAAGAPQEIKENRITGGGAAFGTEAQISAGPVIRTGLSLTKIAVASERYTPPTYTQQAYRLFANTDTTDVGSPLAAQDTAGTLIAAGGTFRLRSLVRVDGNDLLTNGQSMKLQFAQQSGTCDTAFSGETYSDVTTSSVIAYKDNTTPTDETALTANANDPTDGGRTIVNQSYQELNNLNNTQASILNGQDGKWDFALYDNGAPTNTTYCFRMVKSDGTQLNTYTTIPQITTASSGGALSVDIVDSGGTPVASPSMQMNSVVMSLGYQTATGTFGVSAQKMRVNNTTGNAQWSASIAADAGNTAFWNGVNDYDFNDPTANAGDGGDADSLGGRMTVDPSVGTLGGTCSTTGVTKGGAAGFSQGVTDSITLLTAGGTANTGCYWDFTGIGISQTIPGEQATDNYTIPMTLTVVAI